MYLSQSPSSLPLAITMGDAAGIGPEIIAQLYREAPEDLAGSFVVGDVAIMRRAASISLRTGCLPLPVALIQNPAEAWSVPQLCIPVLQPCPGPGAVAWGQISPAAGAFAGACVVWAARSALRGQIAGLVTAPL
ncbi:MAG: 4-hydroxythreonine-4-phosphate dehydrogenase PdxA, partial [Burkholderiales bacterium PBB4]